MLAVSALRERKDERELERFPVGIDEFPEFSTDNLLESIDFDDLFVGIDGAELLPDLDLSEFSGSGGEEYSSEINNSSFEKVDGGSRKSDKEEREEINLGSKLSSKGEEIGSGSDESVVVNSLGKESEKGRKSSKNHHGKRKVKVDWTPELHRRFVQAVEQLGVDKAVPSRILELMGIDCLTRHNIASHLQKYRSHRKHMLAREAEAVSWSQRQQMYTGNGLGVGGGCKREIGGCGPWLAVAPSTMGFPPMAPLHHPHFRPLHVWGHPPTNQSPVHIWPKHVVPPHPLPVPPLSHPSLPPPDPSFWHAHHQRVSNAFTPGAPYYPSPSMAPTRYPSPAVTGIAQHAMYRADPALGVSKESIDAVIGDVLTKPWQPLPLGLKPPSLDGVMVELNRHGVPNIPPSCT
ncbi:hypothetical protein LguiB_002275 [Lonicera macranthoides]